MSEPTEVGVELTQDQSMAMDFIGDLQNKITREGKHDDWKDNVLKNRKWFSMGNPDLIGLTAFVVCAGPSLDKNADLLKNISGRGVIVCVDAAFRFLSQRGINPEYCIMIDGSDKMLKMMEGTNTEDTMLVCTPSACPEVVDAWKGPKYFVGTPHTGVERKFNLQPYTRIVKAKHDLKEGDELFHGDDYEVEFEGVNTQIMCGGNVSTAAHHFALVHIKAQQVIFVGLDLSWVHESHHYAGHEHLDNVHDRTKTGAGTHMDSNGKEVTTNLSLLSFKRWHEQFSKQAPGSVVNATEGGILGIDQNGNKMDFIDFMTLEESIKRFTPEVTR